MIKRAKNPTKSVINHQKMVMKENETDKTKITSVMNSLNLAMKWRNLVIIHLNIPVIISKIDKKSKKLRDDFTDSNNDDKDTRKSSSKSSKPAVTKKIDNKSKNYNDEFTNSSDNQYHKKNQWQTKKIQRCIY